MFGKLFGKSKKPKDTSRTPAQRMMTTDKADIYYLPITKCGSTYLKNLFFYLDFGKEHPFGNDVHSSVIQQKRANTGDEDKIKESRFAFTVIREPSDRFASLYFDKIYGNGPRNFPDIRESLVFEIGLNLARDLDVEGHRENCRKLIEWFAKNLAHETGLPVNPHWRRQSSRLQRVKDLDLEYLTLDGINWQLPLLIEEVVPDIRETMEKVKSWNKTPRPFKNSELFDDALLARIREVYRQDWEIYQATSEKWQDRETVRAIPEVKPDKLTVMSAGDLPIYCVSIPKAGCTYLKNLFYLLENGSLYPDPAQIHGTDSVSHSDLDKEQLSAGISFMVLRDPVERFFSLYFDKIFGIGPQAFPWIATRLQKNREFYKGPEASLEEHRINCISFLIYLELRFANNTAAELNPHWRPQVATAREALSFGLKPVMLERIDVQLPAIAKGRIVGLEAAMKSVPFRNGAPRPFTADEIMTPEISKRISGLYATDQALYERVKAIWGDLG